VKYTADSELLANEETVLQVMTDRLIEIGKFCGMEMNVEKTKVMGNSSNYPPTQILINQKPLENVEYLKYFVSKVTNDANMFTRNQTHNGQGNSSTQQEES